MAFCDQDVLLTETAERPVSAAKRLGRQYDTPADRSHPKGRSAAEDPPWRRASREGLARTFEAPWRVDGDRAAWRRGVEGESSAPPKAQAFPWTALRATRRRWREAPDEG